MRRLDVRDGFFARCERCEAVWLGSSACELFLDGPPPREVLAFMWDVASRERSVAATYRSPSVQAAGACIVCLRALVAERVAGLDASVLACEEHGLLLLPGTLNEAMVALHSASARQVRSALAASHAGSVLAAVYDALT
jgi:hypothetical protein